MITKKKQMYYAKNLKVHVMESGCYEIRKHLTDIKI